MTKRMIVLAALAVACGRDDASSTPAVASAEAAKAVGPIVVRLLSFNDFHGNLKPPTGRVAGVEGDVGGAGYFAAHLRKLGAGKPGTLVVSAGDLVGASPFTSALFHDEPTVAVMNELGLSVTSLGNHELDEGLDELLRLKSGGCHPKDGCKFEPTFRGAKFDYLGANVRSSSVAHPMPLPSWVVREVSGVKIAFVGMTLEATPLGLFPEAAAGLSFADEVTTANALVPEIKAQGIEAIVLLIHQGGNVEAPALDSCTNFRGPIVDIVEHLDPAFDAVVSGHTHALYNCVVAGKPVTSALSFGRVVTSIDLTIDPTTHDVIHAEAKNHPITHDLPPDPAVQAIVDRASAASAPQENRVIGRINANISLGSAALESPLGNVVADAQLEVTRNHGATVALLNTNGIRSDLLFAKSGDETEDGLVTYGEAFAVQPFGNELVTLTITARQLMTVLEASLWEHANMQVSYGVTVRYEIDGVTGKKHVVALVLGGSTLDSSANVRITTSSFLAETDPALKTGTNRVVGPTDLAALEMYFAAHPTVTAARTPRFVAN